MSMLDEPITLVSVVREPLLNLFQFITWHRKQGVSRFVLYFDNPSDPALSALAGIADVTCVSCTPMFWLSLGHTPEDRFVRRQCAALTHGYRQVLKGWVAVCDGDEFFQSMAGGLHSVVARAPDDVSAVRVLPAEPIQTDADDSLIHFRTPIPKFAVASIYGDVGLLVRRNGGLVGHKQGKSITRAGLPIRVMRQHWAQDHNDVAVPEIVVGRGEGALLLHFFDRGYESWRAKLDWRLGAWGFPRPIAASLWPLNEAIRAGGELARQAEADVKSIYRALHHFDQAKLKALEEAGGLYCLPKADFHLIDHDLAPTDTSEAEQ